ncbi:glycosyltransferase [Acidobacteriota bacterium]
MKKDLPNGTGFLTRNRVFQSLKPIEVISLTKTFRHWYHLIRRFTRSHELPIAFLIEASYTMLTGARLFTGYHRLLLRLRPVAVVVEYDRNAATVPLILAANSLKIPTLTFQHGMINHPYGYTPLVANTIMVWGRQSRDLLIRFGVPDRRIRIVGCPAVDYSQKVNEGGVRVKMPRVNGTFKIILATSPISISSRLEMVRVFCEGLFKRTDLTLSIKLHPSESIDNYRKEVAKYPQVRFFEAKQVTKEEALATAHVVVCHNTGLGLEAMAYGKPVVILDVVKEPIVGAGDWVKYAKCPAPKNAEELRAAVLRILFNQEYRRQLHNAAANFITSVYRYTGQIAAECARKVICEATERKNHP